jgi:hypothetical protein
MTALALATIALYAGAAIAAVLNRYRAVALYLGAVLAIDGLRWCQALLLPHAPELRAGWWLLLWWFEVGPYLASILALPMMAIALFSKSKRLRYIPLLWLFATIVIAGSYPHIRGQAIMRIYDTAELFAVTVSFFCIGLWVRSGRVLVEGRSPEHLAGLALIAGPAGSILLPMIGGDTLKDWRFIVAGNAVAVGIALVLLLWGICALLKLQIGAADSTQSLRVLSQLMALFFTMVYIMKCLIMMIRFRRVSYLDLS